MKKLLLSLFALGHIVAMPAWGMDYVNAVANMVTPLLPIAATAYIFRQKNGLMPFKEEYDTAVRNVFNKSFNFVPHIYDKDPRTREVKVWKENNHIRGALIFEKKSPIEATLHYIGVHPDAQGAYVGTQIVKAFEAELAATCPSSSCAITLHSYTKTLGFYKKNGYTCGDRNTCRKEFASTNSVQQQNKENFI
jgi:ribosomal protein S18 acetylase RimI-like enzyme